MDPLIKKYREVTTYQRPHENKEFHPDSSFWGMWGSTVPWAMWGYIIGAAIGLFVVLYYVAWPVVKILYVEPLLGGP